MSIPDCDCSAIWDAPTVDAAGSRYLAITPDEDVPFDMSFVVSCSAGGSDMYTQEPSGSLNVSTLTYSSGSADFLPPDEWLDSFDALYVKGTDLAPDTTYSVEVDFGASWNSSAATATTWPYGDVDDSGGADMKDVACVVECYGGNFGTTACPNSTEYTCDVVGETGSMCLPNEVCDFRDISDVVAAVQSGTYPCSDGCD